MFNKRLERLIGLSLILMLLAAPLSACTVFQEVMTPGTDISFQLAEVKFRVTLLEKLPQDSKLMLEILDDVTGLYFNSSRFEMSPEGENIYSIRIPLKVLTELKYRYVLDSSTPVSYEQDAEQRQVRFRLLRIDGPQIVEDIVAGWPGSEYRGSVGQITGQVIDQASNAPIPNLLVTAGGSQSISSSDGSFIINNLVPGVHNLVIYSMDGVYETFQQGALIADGATTPVQVFLVKRPTTIVTFDAIIPTGNYNNMPLRFVNNWLNLGNAYADLSSGSSGAAINYPVMTRISRNRYSLTLELPVGAYIRYKYSFGDGFWNSELSDSGNFVTRDLLVREETRVKNRVSSFSSPDSAEIQFILKTPDNTPVQETVFLQFKPFGWMEPIPMISKGSGIWEYTLYSPLHLVNTFEFHYCRNGECEIAAGVENGVNSITPLSTVQEVTSVVTEWRGLSVDNLDASKLLVHDSLQPRADLIAGVELTPEFYAGWRSSIDDGLMFAAKLGGDYVVLSPTWTARISGNPELNVEPGRDLLWTEAMTQINHVTMSGQLTYLYPRINYAQEPEIFRKSIDSSEEAQAAWFEQFRRFLFHYADLAQIMDVKGMIIEEPAVLCLPNTQTSIYQDATSCALSSAQWDSLITGIRARYSGTLIGVAIFNADISFVPEWLDQVDVIYTLLSPAIELSDGSAEEIDGEFDRILDTLVYPALKVYDKPVLIGISYPSSDKANLGMPASQYNQIVTPHSADNEVVALELQAKLYNSAVLSSASRDWISGFFARGFYPYAELQDGSSSIYRKPTSEILWFWFHYLLNKTP